MSKHHDRFITLRIHDMSWLKLIPPAHHGLWLSLMWYGGTNGKVWASRQTLADMVGISERSVSRGLRALESCRAIGLEERSGQTSLIQLLTLDSSVNPTLDSSVNPPLTEVSGVPLTEVSTPLDSSVNPPLTEVSSKEEKEEAKLKVQLSKKMKEEKHDATHVLDMDWHCLQLFNLYTKYSDPSGPLDRKHWRCPEDTTFMDWYSCLPIPPSEWHTNAWVRITKGMDSWMAKQASLPDMGKCWRYEYWQTGMVAWIERNKPSKPSYVREAPMPTPAQQEVHSALSRADNEWLSMLALGMDDNKPSEAVVEAMKSYPDDNFLKAIFVKKYGHLV